MLRCDGVGRHGVRQRHCVRQRWFDATEHCPLVQALRRDWAKGQVNSKQVSEYTRKAQGCDGVEKAASSGTYGRHPQNLHRDLLSLFKDVRGAPPLDWVELPTTESPAADDTWG